jgi:hypothetical protein
LLADCEVCPRDLAGQVDGYHLMATRDGIPPHVHRFDEIYVRATFFDAGGGRRSRISNVVAGHF